MGTVVVAFGGNALQPPAGDVIDPAVDLRGAANAIADIVEEGHHLVITHGNGPQVGYGVMRNVWAPDKVPRLPMAALVAQSQGELGTLISVALTNAYSGLVLSLISILVFGSASPNALSASRAVASARSSAARMVVISTKVMTTATNSSASCTVP